MKLSRYSGSKPQSAEDWIGGGPFRFAGDPLLHAGEALGGLMNVVAVNVGDRLEQLLEAFVAAADRGRRWLAGAASRHQSDSARSVVLSHPIAFPRDISATIAETSRSAVTQFHPVAG
jgi:hypothetical protein